VSVDTDQALKSLIAHSEQFDDVELLSFGGVTAAGYEQVGHLNKFPKLRIGEWIEDPIDGQGLRQLSKWTNVRVLLFNGCPNVRDVDLQHLVDLPHLEEFSLVEEGGGLAISDAGLVHIGQMKKLKKLMLMSLTQVTDAGLTQLHRLTNLEDLVIRRTAVTEAGIQQFIKAFAVRSSNRQPHVPAQLPPRAVDQMAIVRRAGNAIPEAARAGYKIFAD
jgi:hypothetical protein